MIERVGRACCFTFLLVFRMLINDYVEWLIDNRWFSINTVKNYERTLNLFDRYLKSVSLWKRGVEQCEDIKLMDVNLFIQQNKNLWKDTRTCNNYTACIKLFLRFCLVVGYKVEDYRKILYAREVKKKIDSLSDKECEKLMRFFRKVKCRNEKEELIKTRNLCIVQLLLYTWLRVSELASIKIKDVKRELQIIWKWWKRRVVFLYPEDLKMIDLYLFMRKKIDSEYLFVSHSSNCEWKPLSRVSIEKFIREWWRQVWVDVFPHKLRHTFATCLLREKVDLVHIQNLLWHSNINTTMGYLSVLNTDLEKAQRRVKRY